MSQAYSASSATAKDGAATADFVVKRTGTKSDLGRASSVSFSTEDVTAKAGTDYITTSGTLDFAAGVTEMPLSVGIVDAAYTSKTILTFLVKLKEFGDATGSIVPKASGESKQTFLYVPEDNTETAIPTKDKPGSNLPNQALSDDFSDPPDGKTQIDRPLAYLRLGYARADMNYYERVIVDNDAYHPKWRVGGADPIEPGAMDQFMLPRGVNRISTNKSSAEANNAHLDGVLIYSDKNYNVTVGGTATTVVQDDYVLSVEGTARINYKDRKVEWVYDGGTNSFRLANGITTIEGQSALYDIASIRNLKVRAEQEVSYSFGARYTASADAKMTVSNSAEYNISNSIKLDVKGPQIAAECDFMGNFEVKYPSGEVMSTRGQVGLAATEEINLSLQAGTATAWKAAVATAANANALAAAAITAGVPAATFGSNSEFYSLATPENLNTVYSVAVGSVLPDTCAGLAAITASVLVGAAVAQAIAEELPEPMPKIEMTPESLKLSVGPQSMIQMTAADIIISAPNVLMTGEASVNVTSAAEVAIEAAGTASLEAPLFDINAPQTSMLDLSCADIDGFMIDAFSIETVL